MLLTKINPKRFLKSRELKLHGRKLSKHIQNVKVIGVTGSAGKTITAHLISQILTYGGYKVGFVGTEGIWLNEKQITADFAVNVATASELTEAISELTSRGIEYLVLEASAQNIAQGKFFGITFDSVAVTNIGGGTFSQDFQSDQEYAESIFSLLHQIENEGMVVLNADDDAAEWIAQSSQSISQNIYAAWVSKQHVEELQHSLSGIKFKFAGGFFDIQAMSSLYLEDVILAIRLCAKYLGVDKIDEALNNYKGLSGREQILAQTPYSVMIDYAYEPLLIDMLLGDIRKLVQSPHRLITIIGAAGNRGDERKKVGIPAARYSDLVLIAGLDPRGENVVHINSRIAEYAENFKGVLVERINDMNEYEAIPKQNLIDKIDRVTMNSDVPMVSFDAQTPGGRYAAIDFAVNYARPGDVIVLLGKGDDQVMDFGSTLFEWNDAQAATEVLSQHETTMAQQKYVESPSQG